MQATSLERSPLAICADPLAQAPGPALQPAAARRLAGALLTDRAALPAWARMAARDFALTVRLLRLANSALFHPEGGAVLRLSHVAALLGTDALAEMLDGLPRRQALFPERGLLALSLATSHIAGRLMERRDPRLVEEAAICGLLRNCGEVCFAAAHGEEYRRILQSSAGQLSGLRAACRSLRHFDFDELSAALLAQWAIGGPALAAAQASPDALLARAAGGPDAEIALAAAVAHSLAAAQLRASDAEANRLAKALARPLAVAYGLRDPQQAAHWIEDALQYAASALDWSALTRDRLLLSHWIRAEEPVTTPDRLPSGAGLETLLLAAVASGARRAAWITVDGANLDLTTRVGNWDTAAVDALLATLEPRRPPALLAFHQAQDVALEFPRDSRFAAWPLAVALSPSAVLLLPVRSGRNVEGCFYFDWAGATPDLALCAAIRADWLTNRPGA